MRCGAGESVLEHVGDVEETGRVTDVVVSGGLANVGVREGHGVAGERDHLGALRDVVVE